MKKLFAILAIAGSLAACNNSADSTSEKKDSIDSVTSERKDMVDSTTDAKKNMADSTADATKNKMDSSADAKKATLNKVDSMNKEASKHKH